MPFEPRIVGGDAGDERDSPALHAALPEPVWDDAAQLDLPDDLAALAEQLRDDAIYMAKRHPAPAAPHLREDVLPAAWEAATRRGGWYRRGATAAAVLLAVAGGWSIWQMARGEHQPPAVAGNQSLSASAERAAVGDASPPRPNVVTTAKAGAAKADGDARRQHDLATERPAELPRTVPAAFLHEVSGPELDGMLDLLEEEAELSI